MAIWTPTVKTEKVDLIKDLKKMADSIDDEKVQKETGKRLITDEEANKLARLENYDDTKLNEKIEEQAEQIAQLEKEKNQLLKDHKPIPFNSSSNHLVDTGELPMPISINGGIEQDTRVGYNLIDTRNAYEVTKAGVTLTVDKETQEITLNGECTTDNTPFALNVPMECKAGDYTVGFKYVSGSVTIPSGKVSSINLQSNDWKGFVTNLANNDYFQNHTISSDLSITYTAIRCDSGCVYNNYKIKPFLASGKDKPFDLYGSMPSLEFPSEVKGVGSEEHINLYNIGDVEETTQNGVTYSIKNGKFKANGKATASFSIITSSVKFDLKSGDYLFGAKNVKGTYSGIVGKYVTKSGGTNVIDGNLIDTTVRKTLTEDYTNVYASMYINSNAVFDNYEADLLLVKGTYQTRDEMPPFTPYGYCRYENVISNKNIFDGEIELGNIVNGANATHTDVYRSKNYMRIKPNTQYAFSFNGVLNKVIICMYDKDKKYIGLDEVGLAVSNGLFTTYENAEYLRFRSYGSDILIVQTAKIQLEENTVATPFTPHQEQNINIDIPINKEIFDKNNYGVLDAYFNNLANPYITPYSNVKTVYTECKENQKYNILKIASARFYVGYTTELPKNNVTVHNVIGTDQQKETMQTITTGKDAKYLCVFLYHSTHDTTVTFEEIVNSLSIKEDNMMYGGKAYKKDGKWYRDEEYKKYVFSGNETFVGVKNANNLTYFYNDKVITDYSKSNRECYSNYFKTTSNIWENKDSEDLMSLAMNSVTVNFMCKDIQDLTLFKTMLKEKYANGTPVYVVYRLAEPYTVQITDERLIAQLEELQKVKSYYEVTNINSYRPTEDVAEMKLSGNALMSNDIRLSKLESAVLSIGGNV